MPSIISHPAVAVALAPVFQWFRVPKKIFFLGAFCTIVPDFDVVGFLFGIEYQSLFGHRGFSHSLLFAALFSAFIVYGFSRQRTDLPLVACFIFLFLCTASHGIFDALTNGGHGVAFFTPVDQTRYFFSSRPIQVSPIGVSRFLSRWGATVLFTEILWMWIPALVFGIVVMIVNKFTSKK